MQTGKLLHSHLFKAPLSGNQEVSGFGESGNGDTGDNWTVVCDNDSDKHWMRGQPIHLQHVDTSRFLYTSEQVKFTTSNCGHGCPIMGQLEVSASQKKDVRSKWVSTQGVYFPPREEAPQRMNCNQIETNIYIIILFKISSKARIDIGQFTL